MDADKYIIPKGESLGETPITSFVLKAKISPMQEKKLFTFFQSASDKEPPSYAPLSPSLLKIMCPFKGRDNNYYDIF
jgi:hypothetical protein